MTEKYEEKLFFKESILLYRYKSISLRFFRKIFLAGTRLLNSQIVFLYLKKNEEKAYEKHMITSELYRTMYRRC